MAKLQHQEGRHRPGHPAGKDKGGTGEPARSSRPTPTTERVLVEGVNRIKKHTKVGQTAARRQDRRHRHPGGPDPRQQRAAGRDPEGKKPHPDRLPRRDASATAATKTRPRSASPSAPVRTSDDRTDATTERPRRSLPRLKARYREEIAPALRERVRLRQRHAGPRPGQDRRQHGCRRGRPRLQADRRRGPRPGRDHRPEAAGHQGAQVHRAVQAARGHADRRPRHAARRPDVGVPRPAALHRAAPHP